MPNDLSIQAAAPASIGSGGFVPARSAAAAAPVEHATSLPSPSPNPTLELNAALGLVVIEFRNSAGAVTSSIPTAQQLEAYRLWQESGVGPAPNLGVSMADAVHAPGSATAGNHGRSTSLGVGD